MNKGSDDFYNGFLRQCALDSLAKPCGGRRNVVMNADTLNAIDTIKTKTGVDSTSKILRVCVALVAEVMQA